MIVIDTQELNPGLITLGQETFGVLGSAISTSGDSGPSPINNDISHPADDNTEFLLQVVTPPASGTLLFDDFGNFTYTPVADGIFSFTYQLRSPGVLYPGVGTVNLVIGDGTQATVTLVESGSETIAVTAAVSSNAPITCTIVIVETGSEGISATSYIQQPAEVVNVVSTSGLNLVILEDGTLAVVLASIGQSVNLAITNTGQTVALLGKPGYPANVSISSAGRVLPLM